MDEQQVDSLLEELDRLRTPRDGWGRKYLGIAIHNLARIREIRKLLEGSNHGHQQ